MLNGIEFAIVRYGAQLRRESTERVLTDEEQELLEICEDETHRLDIREAQTDPPPRKSRWTARSGR